MNGIEVSLPYAGAPFTTRAGGVSEGPFDSLNLAPWTDDDVIAIAENGRRVTSDIGKPLAQGKQVHGVEVHVWHDESDLGASPEADAHVTTRTDIAPVVLAADCLPIALSTES